ncbi:predicted protein [Sclerotinia sclerotiorum 1980 UF-70]|uniref:Uncharacterized protein n=1 Tax=Sclerotinia sclerotiorum (strain ATCC 18683 / 1980 / Ss-1) TaxID=665079 RepID=A7ELQ1_SCLS1|nr:predicted protein [Sclerotinia sclerotiorum 1980 UF-70]EDO03767.1 predicted protein [Sclerotinia sclerotiorum 1980 UF-70]
MSTTPLSKTGPTGRRDESGMRYSTKFYFASGHTCIDTFTVGPKHHLGIPPDTKP